MIKYCVKKFVLSNINKLLKDYESKVDVIKTTVQTWLVRLGKIINSLNTLIAKLDDNLLTDEEVEQVKDDIEKVIKEW